MPEVNNWKRRHAIQITAQLPEDPIEALAVLDLARGLVQSFLMESQPALVCDRGSDVRAFPASASSR
jgi:hypothetical protein